MRDIAEGVRLFNDGLFFEAHEAWEHQWLRAADPDDKEFLQSLIMIAGALHHWTKKEYAGAVKLLAKSASKLEKLAVYRGNIDLQGLKDGVLDLAEKMSGCAPCVTVQDLPRIREREAA